MPPYYLARNAGWIGTCQLENSVAAAGLNASMRRIVGERADYLLALAGSTVKRVVYGILGTVLGQGILAGFGCWIAGVPAPALLGLATFFLSVIRGGPVG